MTKVDITTCRVLYPYNYVLLFGGEVKDLEEDFKERAQGKYSISLRHWVTSESYNYQTKDLNFILPEDFQDYLSEGEYDNLFDFEIDFISLCTLVVVFLESAGSLVEFGMLSTMKDFYRKILVVVHKEYETKQSFIMYGPIKNISKIAKDNVIFYPTPNSHSEYSKDDLRELCTDIYSLYVNLRKKSNQFDKRNKGHLIFLVYELVKDFYPIKLFEIEYILGNLGVSLEEKVLKNYIYILKKVKLISETSYSSSKFYYPLLKEPCFQYASSGSKNKFDINKLVFNLRQYIKNDVGERKRGTVLKQLGVI